MEQALHPHPSPARPARPRRLLSRLVRTGILGAILALAPVSWRPVWSQPVDLLTLAPAGGEQALQRYLDGLRQGDVTVLRDVLGCGLLSKHRALLRHPAFGPRLAAVYTGARMRVAEHRLVSRNRVEIEAVIERPGHAPRRRLFVLQRRTGSEDFVVCAETPAAEFARLDSAAHASMLGADLKSLARDRPESIEGAAARFAQPPEVLF